MATRNDSVFDVIIIGCGASGIGAAIELEKIDGSKNYLILEGRNRIGGRAWTDRTTFGETTPVDIGAHYLCHQNEENFLLQHYSPSADDFIESDVYNPQTMRIFDDNGHSVPDETIERASQLVNGLLAAAQSYTSEDADLSLQAFLNPHLKDIVDPALRRLVDLYLTYAELHEGTDLDALSSVSYGKGEGGLDECDIALSKGFGTLVQEIASKYTLPIELNAIVTHIDVLDDDIVRLRTEDHRSYLSRYVLITIPLGCLKSKMIEFSPPLPSWKENAINRMGFGLLNKVYLQFPDIFWEAHLRRISVATERYKVYYCLPEHRLLILLISGSSARILEEKADEDVVHEIVSSLRRVYPQMPSPTRWLITRWKSDRFSQGSYSSYSLGSSPETVTTLATETHDGRIHWAGEHTNYEGCLGYVDSGFQSGMREGKKIRNKLQSSK